MKRGIVVRRTVSLARARLSAVRSSFVDVFAAMTFVMVPGGEADPPEHAGHGKPAG